MEAVAVIRLLSKRSGLLDLRVAPSVAVKEEELDSLTVDDKKYTCLNSAKEARNYSIWTQDSAAAPPSDSKRAPIASLGLLPLKRATSQHRHVSPRTSISLSPAGKLMVKTRPSFSSAPSLSQLDTILFSLHPHIRCLTSNYSPYSLPS